MSGTQKPHFAIDLNEIERQLAQAQSAAPPQTFSNGRHDPLADLARIVGQDDPFEALLNGRAPQKDRREPLFAPRVEADDGSYDRHGISHSDRDYDDEPAEVRNPGQSYAYQHPAVADHGPYNAQSYDQNDYDQDHYDGDGVSHAPHYEAAYQAPPRRSRKGVLAVGAILGVVLVGTASAFMFGGGSAAITGEPILITASNEPVKVAPQNPGGVEIPNQNKQIYERAAPTGETKVVSNSEQPVDVKQAVSATGGAVADATGAAPQATNGLNLGEPRKVRTIAIRPDGTLVRPEAETKVAAAAPPTMSMPAVTPSSPPPAAVAAPVAVATPAPAPKPAVATPAAKPAPPVAATQTPAPAPAPQRVASAQPTALPETASADAPVSGFSVQLAVRGSEKDAQTAFAQFQKKYAGLAGQAPMIRKAEVNGNTVFRVRAGPMSRDDASQLCSAVQGQGGQCFVAKN